MTRGFSNNPYTKAALVLLGGLGLLLVGCRRDGASGEGAADGSKPLARVAGLPITEKQFRHQWRHQTGTNRDAQGHPDHPPGQRRRLPAHGSIGPGLPGLVQLQCLHR